MSLMMPESQKHSVTLPQVTIFPTPKRSKMGIFEIFPIFDPYENGQKLKLGQFLKYTPRNTPEDVRKSKRLSNNALGDQIRRPKNDENNVEKHTFCDFWHF